jgi:hypothetical protein
MEHAKNCIVKALLVLSVLIFSLVGSAMPSKVILVRHGEEPTGDEGRELSERGWARAHGFPDLFSNQKLTHLIALKPHKKNGSIRSIQTLQPISEISEAYGIELQAPFERDEVPDLVEALSSASFDGKVVLIAWQHETLADIAHGLGATMAPQEWGKPFDRFWILEFNNEKLDSFKDLPQRLLPGDSED